MADLASSLIGIIGAGTKVAMVLSQVTCEIGSAGKEAQIMAREIRSFCTIIRILSQTLDNVHSDMNWSQYSHCSETISDMTAVSKQMFSEILDLVDTIQKASWGSSVSLSSAKFNLASRIRWVMNKPKFAFLRSALDAYKSNLSLLLGSIQLLQSLGSQSTHSSSGSDDDMFQRPGSFNRASLALSIDLQNMANDYQASIQEMEAIRLDAENELPTDPPWEALPDDGDQADTMTIEARQDPQLQELITTARDEVHNLRPESSVYSGSTASIYSSLSLHSRHLSLVVDELPMLETMDIFFEQRESNTPSIRTTSRLTISHGLFSAPEAKSLREPEQIRQLEAKAAGTQTPAPTPPELERQLRKTQIDLTLDQLEAKAVAPRAPTRRNTPDNEDWKERLERMERRLRKRQIDLTLDQLEAKAAAPRTPAHRNTSDNKDWNEWLESLGPIPDWCSKEKSQNNQC